MLNYEQYSACCNARGFEPLRLVIWFQIASKAACAKTRFPGETTLGAYYKFSSELNAEIKAGNCPECTGGPIQ